MAPELPGFYFDPEKNRYFPIKGPIPGSSRKSAPQKPPSEPIKVQRSPRRDIRGSRLLHRRELYGNIINFSNRKCSFEEEYAKKLVAQPKVWKYHNLDRDVDGALTVVQTNVTTPEGEYRTDALLTGGVGGSLNLFDIGNVGQYVNYGLRFTSDCIWPEKNEPDFCYMPKDISKMHAVTRHLPSSISSICVPRKEPLDDDGRAMQCALITTLGSDLSGGTLYLLNLTEPVDLNSIIPARGRLRGLLSLNGTIWAGDADCAGTRAVVGTNFGASLVDVEARRTYTICRSKSDVLSVQLNPLSQGNTVLCGLRNGVVVTVDLRQRPPQLARHRIACPPQGTSDPNSGAVQNKTKPWFLLRGNIQPSCTVYMPSAISCLASLQMYDQYFLASSMDGSMRLYDHRLTQRGPIQSYEGHVNTHTRIQLGIDPSERFVISGGVDCKVRIWSIKSGELLFEEKFTNSIPSTVSWRRTRGSSMLGNRTESLDECCYTAGSSWDVWMGSVHGLFRMQFP